MKKTLQASLSAVLVLSLAGCKSTAAPVSSTQSAQNNTFYQDAIDAYVNEINMDYAYDFTKTLSLDPLLHDNSLGFRTSGSDAEHRTADYLAEKMEEIGLKNVEKIPVTVDKWQYNDASLTIDGTDIDLMPVSYMVNGTDKKGITAEIVDCGTGFAEDYEDKDVKGKIALVGVDQYNESWIGGYIYEAYEHGAKALVTYDLDGYGRYSDDDHQIQDVCAEDIMPTAIITMSEYKQIKKALDAGHNKANLVIDSVMEEGKGTSYDVVGYIPGKSHDQQIIFAGHYDMYFTGFQDDCSAIGTIMSMAKTMIDSGYVPENDIVVVAHGAEEWGATGTEFDWTRGAYELINNVHPEWASKTLAMFNFELDAFDDGGDTFMITSVPEYATLVKNLVDEGVLDGAVKDYEKGISAETFDTTTMEDGISYRGAGVPYFLNTTDTCSGSESEDGEYTWSQLHYHTESDNTDTYSEKVMKANIAVFGSIAIAIDQLPAMTLDMQATIDDLSESFNEDLAEEAGVSKEDWENALSVFQKEVDALNAEGKDINERYVKAVSSKADVEAIQEEGKAYNKKVLELFKYVQDNFVGIVFSSDVVMKHVGYQNNIEYMDEVIDDLNDNKISDALDVAYQLNGLCEYNYYLFSPNAAAKIDAHADKAVDNNKWWGNDKGFYFTNTKEATASLLKKEDGDDVSEEIKVYEDARAQQLNYYKDSLEKEIQAMEKIGK